MKFIKTTRHSSATCVNSKCFIFAAFINLLSVVGANIPSLQQGQRLCVTEQAFAVWALPGSTTFSSKVTLLQFQDEVLPP